MNPYKRAIEHWGETAQMEKAIEELDELKAELWEYMNSGRNYNKVLAEMADVCNMLVQLQLMLGIHGDDLAAVMDAKMERTMERIDKEKEDAEHE
jgi:hypothetical protein